MPRHTHLVAIAICIGVGLIAITHGLQAPSKQLTRSTPLHATSEDGPETPESPPVPESLTPASKSPCKFHAMRVGDSYQPQQLQAPAHPTNYGDRYQTDVNGQILTQDCLVVLHETVGSSVGAIDHFQTPKERDEDQVSYHALIALDGTIVHVVPPHKRAYGAGDSVFNGLNGPESVKTNPKLPTSVNNFAYHISLETPADGEHEGPTHSGYTEAQYESLAWLVAAMEVPDDRIVTHAEVDQSGERIDPRSFDMTQFLLRLRSHEVARGT